MPPVKLSELLQGGVTSLVGLLGTDGISRNMESLLARGKALKEEGLTVYLCTGSYGYPSVTLTGDIRKDIMFVEEIIGVKLALSDHRAPMSHWMSWSAWPATRGWRVCFPASAG